MKQGYFGDKENIRYVDMCIWIDNNIYEPDCDLELAYYYMYRIASMLAWKSRDKWTLPTKEDYEGFAHYLAYDVYTQYTQRNVEKRGQIKSVLNYMKGIIRFRRMAYLEKIRQRIKDPKFDEKFDHVGMQSTLKSTYENNNRDIIILESNELIEALPEIIKRSIPAVYRQDKNLYKNIYISSLLTMIDKFTLPNRDIDLVNERIANKPKFDSTSFIRKHLSEDSRQGVILWNLDELYIDAITLIINTASKSFIEDMMDICKDNEISDEDFTNISSSAMGVSNEHSE